MVGEAVKRPRGRPCLNKKPAQETVAVKPRRSRDTKKEKEKDATTKTKQDGPRKRRRTASKYFSQTDYQNGIVGISCAAKYNTNIITKHMRKRYWNSFEEMKLVEYWRRFAKEITTFQHQIPAFRKINDLMRQSGIHITPQECRRKILALKNKFYAEKDRTANDDNSDWNLYPILYDTICSAPQEQNLYAEEETILDYVKKMNTLSLKINNKSILTDKEKKPYFEAKRGTAAWRMISDGPQSIYNVPYLLEWEKESAEVNESKSKDTLAVTAENKTTTPKRSYRRRTTCRSSDRLSSNTKKICLQEIIEENSALNQNLEDDRLRLQKSEAEYAHFVMVIKSFLLNIIGNSLMKRDSAPNVNVTQLSNDIINVTSTKEFANITEMNLINDATVSLDSEKNNQVTVGSDVELIEVSSSSLNDSNSSSDSDSNSDSESDSNSDSEEISNINNKNDETTQDVIVLPSDFKIDDFSDPLEEYARRYFNNKSNIWSVDKENLASSGINSLSVMQTLTDEHKQKKINSVKSTEFDYETNQESPTFNSRHSNESPHDSAIKLDEMNVSSDNDSDEDTAGPVITNESIQPSTSERSKQLNANTEVKISSQTTTKNDDVVEMSASTEKENTNSSSTSKAEDVEEITYFDLPSDDDYDMMSSY